MNMDNTEFYTFSQDGVQWKNHTQIYLHISTNNKNLFLFMFLIISHIYHINDLLAKMFTLPSDWK